MHILILPTAYPNIYNDHSSIFVQDQARALAKHKDIEVNVVGSIPISFKYIWEKKIFKFGFFEYTNHKVKVKLFLFPSIPKLRRFNNFIRFLLNKVMLKKMSNDIDLIHVHNSVAGEAALWCKNKFKIPYCVTEHSSAYARGLVKKYEMNMYKKIYQNAKCNIAVSKEFCRLLRKIFDLNFKYIPNIVDTNFFLPSKKNYSNKSFKFINIANLNKNKNQLSLIKAFSNAFIDNKNVSLLILGGGPEYDNLMKEIEKLNMKEQITLYGFATREEVLRELQNSDSFILSSKYETFGVVLIESMSCGLPVISTKCGGPESIINDEKLGLLVEKNDIEELVNAMLKVYNHRYNRKYIRDYIIENFSEPVVVFKLNEIYEEIVCQKLK